MTAMYLLLSTLALGLGLHHRRHQLDGHETVAHGAQGWLRWQLRRRNRMALLENDGFPRPVEDRVRAWWLGPVLLWTESSSIGLPLETDQRIQAIHATEFDGHFAPRFRIDWTGPVPKGSPSAPATAHAGQSAQRP